MNKIAAALLICILLSSCSSSPQITQSDEPLNNTQLLAPSNKFDVLVFSKTVGWRHDSIEAGIAAIKKLGDTHDFSVTATEESAFFTTADLSSFEAIIFLNTTLDIFNEREQMAFKSYIQQGGGFVGVHAAADTEYDWPWYGELVGAYFESHPDRQTADVLFTDRQHPATTNLPHRLNHYDEWYNYKANPRANVHVLAVVEEETYEGGNMGHDHPIAWAHHYDGGRAFYTGLGHTIESYSDPMILEHLTGAITWAAGAVAADVTASLAGAFDEVVLTKELTDPMEIDVTSDGRVFIVEWAGAVKVWEPDTNKMRVVGWIPVEKKIEDGLLGLALAPNFDTNGWMYIYYAPIDNNKTFNRLSRFTYNGKHIDMESEIAVLEIPNQRVTCCHSAGSVQFDKHGNLYLSTGDNSGGNRDTSDVTIRKYADQGRTAGNTNDLRGKILRITPQPDGTYTIPEGNLFEADDLHRGEIFTMGHRNPFRYSIDDKTGWIYWGDVGPGAGNGFDEFNQARGPGNFGWPLFTGRNVAFNGYHFAGGKDDMAAYQIPDAPINASPFNTGARELPPAQSSIIPYLYGTSQEFPELGAGGMNPMGGPVFHYNAETASPHALPEFYDDKVMIYEWMRNWVQVMTLDDKGDVMKIDPFLPGLDFISPMDIEVGPQGRLYILEWGQEFWGSNENAQLVRLDYHGKDIQEKKEKPTLATAGPITITSPVDGGFFDFGDPIAFSVDLTDKALEDHAYVQTYTGFDTSPIPLERYDRLSGELSISTEYTHKPDIHYVDRFATVEACVVEGSATTCDAVKLHPKNKEAEHTSSRKNATRKTYSAHPASRHWGGTALTVLAVKNESRLTYDPINLKGIDSITFRFRTDNNVTMHVAFGDAFSTSMSLNNEAGVPVELEQAKYKARFANANERSLRRIDPNAYKNWREITLPITSPSGSNVLTLKFESEAKGTLMELDLLRFNGKGVAK